MVDCHTSSSRGFKKHRLVEEELGFDDDDDNISCQTGAATIVASNKSNSVALISPEKMQQDDNCRPLLAQLLWLVSVHAPEETGVYNRRSPCANFKYMLQWDFNGVDIPHNAFYKMLRASGGNDAVLNMEGVLVTELFEALNKHGERTIMETFPRRDRLLRLLNHILDGPPSNVASVETENATEKISELTAHDGEDTSVAGNTRGMMHALPDMGALNLGPMVEPPVAPGNEFVDNFAGDTIGLPISEDTPPDEDNSIVADFRAGNYTRLEQAHQKDAVISALASNVTVMRSLLVLPVVRAGDATSLETQMPGVGEA